MEDTTTHVPQDVASPAADAIPEEFVLTLRKPLKNGPVEYETITLREPTVAQLAESEQFEGVAAAADAISAVGGVPKAVVLQMGARDHRAAVAYLDRFFAAGKNIGADFAEPDPTDISDALTITLRKPVTFDGKTYSEINLREPTSAEWIEWDKLTGTAADIKAISLISNIPALAIKQIGARDFLAAARYVGHFFTDAPTTGVQS